MKKLLENVNIDLKYLYNLDLRFALSNEKTVTETVLIKMQIILEKKRYSLNFGKDSLFSFDLTEISKINKDEKGKVVREAQNFKLN